jgi:DNA-directed RNA polymerase specialized sigma24 family protein
MKTYPTDSQLTRLLMAGDKAAFEFLYRKYVQALYTFSHRVIRAREECEDFVQEIFETLWLRRKILGHLTIVNTDLYKTMTHKLIWRFQDHYPNRIIGSLSTDDTDDRIPPDSLLEKYLQDAVTPDERILIEDWLDNLRTDETTELRLSIEDEEKLFLRIVASLERKQIIRMKPEPEPKEGPKLWIYVWVLAILTFVMVLLWKII